MATGDNSANSSENIAASANAAIGASGGVGGSWWNSLLQTAKEKSMTALEMMKSDLIEFTTTMKEDLNKATQQVQETNNKILTKVQQTAANTKTQAKRSTEANNSGGSNIYDRFKNEIFSLQNNDLTYIDDPKEQYLNEYKEWYEHYDPDMHKSVISNLLIENATMRGLYSQLVPASVSNKDFWSRYFFKVKLIEEEHNKRMNLIKKANQSDTSFENLNEWDEEDEENGEKENLDELKRNDLKEATNETKTNEKCELIGSIETNDVNKTEKVEQTNPVNTDHDSDEWEKDFEMATTSDDNSKSKVIADDSVTPKSADTNKTKDGNDETKPAAAVPAVADKTDDGEKSDDWESWD